MKNLPAAMRQALIDELPWQTLTIDTLQTSAAGDTHKALCRMVDGQKIETVLMANARDQWTICVSSQVGCAMGCVFCATGKLGLTRSLTTDEIADQYRLWRDWLADRPALPQRISNVVFMGMGEPLTNYDAVKDTLTTWLTDTDLGPTHITVSSVGLLPQLEKLLADPTWPSVRLAISLHAADGALRKSIVPTSAPDFLPQLADWAKRFLHAKNKRRNHLTFEYILLAGVNDSPRQAKQLADFVTRIGKIKVNVIPYNTIAAPDLQASATTAITQFKQKLTDCGVVVTQRKTMGDDIAAACGQLAASEQK